MLFNNCCKKGCGSLHSFNDSIIMVCDMEKNNEKENDQNQIIKKQKNNKRKKENESKNSDSNIKNKNDKKQKNSLF